MKEKYWVSLGKSECGGTYPQSVIHIPHWKDSAMRDSTVIALIELEVDMKNGTVESKFIKKEV